ncbi:MAG: hypothetical protein V1494_07700 [Candidatus Diapherotrites archaeon]
MAKPIRATPTLVGKEAMAFLEKMKKNDSAKPGKTDRLILGVIAKNQRLFSLQAQ